MLQDLIQLHRAGRLDEAERGYRELLATHPDDPRVLRLLGRLRTERGDVIGGTGLIERAVALAPDDAHGQCALAEAYLTAGRIDDGASAFERGRVLNPNLAAAHAGLGRVELVRGDPAAAEGHFKAALRADPNDIQALAGLGIVANARGDTEEATQRLTQSVRRAPDDVAALTNYALAMLEAGIVDFAGEALDKALRLRADDALAQALRADVFARQGDPDRARAMYSALLARGERTGIAHLGLGDIARATGRRDEAIDEYTAALAAQPILQAAAIRRAEALAEGGRLDEAVEGLRQYVAQHPDGARARVGLATLLGRNGRHADAEAAWAAAVTRWPDDVAIRAGHAVALDLAGQGDAASAEAERAAASPEPGVALLRARAALRAGDPATAVQRLQHVDPQRFEARPGLAMRRLRLLGLAEDAQSHWQEAAAAFVAAQRVTPSHLPELAPLPPGMVATLQTLAAGPALAEARSPVPVLLCGLPGSGVERVAALLADQPGWWVRRDRFAQSLDFLGVPFEPRLVQPLDEPTLELLAYRYRRDVKRTWIRGMTKVVDWVPALDAHVVPAIRRALPGVRLLIVGGDPGDALLNWLGFGWWDKFTMPDAAGGARWLRLASQHLEVAARLLPTYHVDAAAVLATGARAARRQLGEFLGLDDVAWGPLARAARHDRGGLPTSFPPGHVAEYREALADALATLGDA